MMGANEINYETVLNRYKEAFYRKGYSGFLIVVQKKLGNYGIIRIGEIILNSKNKSSLNKSISVISKNINNLIAIEQELIGSVKETTIDLLYRSVFYSNERFSVVTKSLEDYFLERVSKNNISVNSDLEDLDKKISIVLGYLANPSITKPSLEFIADFNYKLTDFDFFKDFRKFNVTNPDKIQKAYDNQKFLLSSYARNKFLYRGFTDCDLSRQAFTYKIIDMKREVGGHGRK